MTKPQPQAASTRKKAAVRAGQYAAGLFSNSAPRYDRYRELIKTAWLVGYRTARAEDRKAFVDICTKAKDARRLKSNQTLRDFDFILETARKALGVKVTE